MASTETATLEPTYIGFVKSTLDALIIFEGCRRGILPKISRRLQDREKHLIASGSVFVFSEAEAGIKRWTDGLIWSPSRILGNFLVYRELNKRGALGSSASEATEDALAEPSPPLSPRKPTLTIPSISELEASNLQRAQERALVGSLTGSSKFKDGGLVKKTISLAGMHMITYYSLDDVYQGRLREPSSLPELNSYDLSADLLISKSFRQPPYVEVGPDGLPRYRGEGDEPEPISPTTSFMLPGNPSPSISSNGSGSAPSSAGGYLSPVGEAMFGGYVGAATASTSASSAGHSRPVSPVGFLHHPGRPNLTRHSSGGPLAGAKPSSFKYEAGRPGSGSQRYEPYGQAGRRSFDEGRGQVYADPSEAARYEAESAAVQPPPPTLGYPQYDYRLQQPHEVYYAHTPPHPAGNHYAAYGTHPSYLPALPPQPQSYAPSTYGMYAPQPFDQPHPPNDQSAPSFSCFESHGGSYATPMPPPTRNARASVSAESGSGGGGGTYAYLVKPSAKSPPSSQRPLPPMIDPSAPPPQPGGLVGGQPSPPILQGGSDLSARPAYYRP